MPTVIIYWSPGRSEDQKANVIHEITEALVNYGSAKRDDVLIIFQEIGAGDSGRAGRLLNPRGSPAALPENRAESPPNRVDGEGG